MLNFNLNILIKEMGIGDWGLGIGDWGLGNHLEGRYHHYLLKYFQALYHDELFSFYEDNL